MNPLSEKIHIAGVGLLGLFASTLIEQSEILFAGAQWVPVILSSWYIIWKWRRDFKKKDW